MLVQNKVLYLSTFLQLIMAAFLRPDLSGLKAANAIIRHALVFWTI